MGVSGQLFSRKARIETVWHHESATFNCIAVDATSRSGPGQRFVMAALFCLDGRIYSIDIGTSEEKRMQLEVGNK